MELDQCTGGEVVASHVLHPVIVGKYPLYKVFPQHVVVQTALFFHRHQRVATNQCLGKQAPAIPAGDIAIFIVHLDALHAAAGRLGHQDVAPQIRQSW